MAKDPSLQDTLADESAGSVRQRAQALTAGQRLGRFVVERKLGAGGMGSVFIAVDEELDRPVAIKVLHPGGRDMETRERLLREAQALAKLSHPNVVQVYEVGEHHGAVFIAMEYVPGQTLREWLEAQARTWPEVVEKFLQAGQGLAAAHEAGLIHRDFKPDNAIVGEDLRVRVLDFGLARAGGPHSGQHEVVSDDAPPPAPEREPTTSGRLSSPLTQTGALMGTPAYMAPEQYLAEAMDARTDQFSFCVALWEALYGARPFKGSSRAMLGYAVLHGKIEAPPRDRPVPAWLHAIVLQGLSTAPDDRHPSMAALLRELQRDRSRGRKALALGGLATALLGVGLASGLVLDRDEPCAGADGAARAAWTAGDAERIASAFEAARLPFGDDALRRVQSQLQAYVTALGAGYVDACEAAEVRHEQSADLRDRRVRCLERNRARLEAAVELLATADADVVEHAADVTAALPPVARCADVALVQAQVTPPDDPRTVEAVAAARETLDAVQTVLSAGRVHEALRRGEAAVEDARALDYAPLLGEALYVHGGSLSARNRPDDAVAILEEGFTVAYGAGDDVTARNCATKLVSVVGFEQRDLAQARRWDVIGAAAAARIGADDPAWHAHHQLARGNAALAGADFDEAEVALRAALDAFESLGGRTSSQAQGTLVSLGALLARRGRPADAIAYFEEVVEIGEQRLGPNHPDIAVALGNLGGVYILLNRPRDALPLQQRALEIASEVFGPDDPQLGGLYAGLGASYDLLERQPEAIENYERSLKIVEANQGPDSHAVVLPLSNLGVARYQEGELDEASALHRRALRVVEATVGAEHPDAGMQHAHLGKIAAARGEYDQALAAFDHAQGIREARGIGHGFLADFRFDAAKAWWESEQDPRALALAQQALDGELADAKGDESHESVVTIRAWLRAAAP